MAFTVQEVATLHRIRKLAGKLLKKDDGALGKGRKAKRAKTSTRKRRTGRELVQFRKMLKAERRKGIPVSEMARKHEISTAYIYLL